MVPRHTPSCGWDRLLHYRALNAPPDSNGGDDRVEIGLLRMKQPDEPVIGGTRKSLPARKSRKMSKEAPPTASKRGEKAMRTKNILDKDVEQELVKVFGEK